MTLTTSDRTVIGRSRAWFYLLGFVQFAAGVLAIAFPFIGTLAVELWTAIAFAIAGAALVVHAFAARQWQGFVLGLLLGLVYIAAGVMLWRFPLQGAVTLTLIVSIAMALGGAMEAVISLRIRPADGWVILLISGLIGIVTGGLILANLPSSAVWVLGLLLGINLMSSGIAFMALAAKADVKPAEAPA